MKMKLEMTPPPPTGLDSLLDELQVETQALKVAIEGLQGLVKFGLTEETRHGVSTHISVKGRRYELLLKATEALKALKVDGHPEMVEVPLKDEMIREVSAAKDLLMKACKLIGG